QTLVLDERHEHGQYRYGAGVARDAEPRDDTDPLALSNHREQPISRSTRRATPVARTVILIRHAHLALLCGYLRHVAPARTGRTAGSPSGGIHPHRGAHRPRARTPLGSVSDA